MDKTASLYCLPIERTSASSCWASIPRCCCNCPQMSGNSNPREQNCNKNFLKCTPWRKKSLIRSTSRWTFLGLNSCLLRLLLLFWSLSNTVGSVFSGIISAKGIPRLRLWWILLIASLFGTILLPVVSSQESVQPKPSVKSKVLPNAVVYVGSVFSYNISEDVFDCNVNSIVVSETADRFLSHWLSYSSNKKQLYGVPSDKDKGTYNILVVALTKDTSLGGHVCGSQSFSIVVMSISEQLPVSVHLSTTGFSSNDHKPALGLWCPPRIQAILGTVVLNMDVQSLNGHQRMMLVVKMAGHLCVDSSKLGFFSGEISNPITQQLDNPTVIAAGVGDGRFAKGIRSFITWNMACGALKLTDVGFSKLETAAQDGTISTLMGVPVVGWHVLSGTQKDMVRRRVRRQAQGIFAITPTPSASSTPPSRLSNMSTLVIVSKTVTLKSASQNSTTLLPSVTPNRTITKTTSVSINSTLFSQLTMKSIQSSTTGFNLTASSLLVNKSMSSSSSIHFNLTESSQPPNKTAFASSSLIFTSSSVSIYPTTSIQFPNRTIFPSYSVSINLTTSSILPNRTIILSPSVSVSLTTSSQLLSATVFKSSSAVNINTSITSILTSSKLLLTLNSSSASGPTNIVSANRTITISESHTPSLNSTFVTRTLSFILSASSPNKSTIVSSQNRSILSSLTMITRNTSQAVISSTIVPSASQGNISIAVTASSLTASFNRSTLVTSVSISSSFPSVLTTLQSTFPAISTAKLNSSIPNVSSLMLITQATVSVTVVPSSFMPVANTSLLITSAASHASLSTVISTTSSNLSSITSKSTFLASSSSLILLPPNTTLVENLTSSAKTSSFVTSSMVILPSTPQPGNSTESKAISPMPTSSLFTSLVSSTMNNTEISLVKTSSLVPSLSNTSSVMLSSSVTQMSSPSMLLLSSTVVNQTSGVQIFSSSTLQPNLTSSKTAVLPSSMSSPIVTNASEVTSVNATTSPLPSSSSLSPSNSTQTATLPGTTRTISVSPSSTSVVIPTTAPPNSPPEVINNLGRVIAPAGVALHYTIPEDTFYDREDGADTRNLSLSMKLANGSSIPEDFWLQFDSESQTIDGLPLDTHVPDGIMGQVLVVYAQDSRGAEALDAFEVLVVPSENPVVQELNIRITNEFVEFSRNVAQRLLLLKKIASYYEDADESNIRVLSFKAGSVIMSWTNDSLPTERCDEEKLQYVANKILLSNGEVRTEFRGALKGFPVVSANEERMGVCNGSYPIITNAPIDAGARTSSEEGDLWYKHVLVGVLIVLILIVLAVLLIWYCRRRRPKPSNEKRTFKKRKPIILEPEIELKPIPGKPLVLPDDSPSFPPSYISETSLDKPVSSDEDDEEDYGKGSPGVRYEPPPPFYGVLDDEDPRNTPPPAYQLPPMF